MQVVAVVEQQLQADRVGEARLEDLADRDPVLGTVDHTQGRPWRDRALAQHPQATPTQALITLTTCNPRWNSSHRMIVFGHLVSTRVK